MKIKQQITSEVEVEVKLPHYRIQKINEVDFFGYAFLSYDGGETCNEMICIKYGKWVKPSVSYETFVLAFLDCGVEVSVDEFEKHYQFANSELTMRYHRNFTKSNGFIEMVS